jgi:hypothetical protein
MLSKLSRVRRSALLGLALLPFLAAEAAAQRERPGSRNVGRRGGGPTTRTNREQMWFAPTAEDWKKPCLVKWQRTWEDALALQKETGRAILVCINMDGEIASEHYAGVRYRRPETASLYDPYICVIASVYRHTPRDFDEQGRRIPCPRFGTVTCGEHIALEPLMFEKFLDGRRIAPRHIGVGLDGKELYDVFYAWDTDSVFKQIKDGAAGYPPPAPPKGDRPLADRAAGKDATDRAFVEAAYLTGDANVRRSLLETALQQGGQASTDLLRLAVFGNDPELAKLARTALAKSESDAAAELMNEALRVPLDAEEKDRLVAALDRIGEKSPRARTLAVVHRGLARGSTAVDAKSWKEALAKGEAPPENADTPEAARPMLEQAESLLKQALRPTATNRDVAALFTDARTLALKAEAAGAKGRRVNAALAVAAYYLEDLKEAHARAEASVKGVPAEPDSYYTMIALGLFADARRNAIREALNAKKPWPGEWLADVHAAYAVLAQHPDGEDSQVASHYDFLRELGALAEAGRTVDAGLKRFPLSPLLHDRLRWQALEEKGIGGMEQVYVALLSAPDADPGLERFAGYASLIAAEYHRRERRDADALAAYERALAHYDRAAKADPAARTTVDGEAVLCLGGRARIALEAGDLDRALRETLAAFARRPEASNVLDGLNFSAVDTAKMLMVKLREQKRDAQAAELDAAFERLRQIDPQLLALPAYEFENAPTSRRQG